MSFYISLQSENQPQNSTEMSWGVVLQGFVFDQMTLIQLCGNQLLCRIPFGSWLWFQLTDMGRHVMWALCVTCCLLRFSITSSLGAGYGFSPCPKMELCSAGTAIAGYDTAGVPPNMEHNWGKKKATREGAVMLWTFARIKSPGPGLWRAPSGPGCVLI